MKLLWSEEGWEDYLHWQESDRAILRRLNALIADIQRGRYTGIGKPEPLRRQAADLWSRRITQEHRLVYRVTDQRLDYLQARYHY